MKKILNSSRHHVRGLTLIELMIGITLGLFVLLALITVMSRNSGNQAELDRTVRQMENARFALDTLSEDIMHAGFYSEFSPRSLPVTPASTNPNICATNTSAMGWDTATTPMQLPAPIQGIDGSTAATCLTNRRAGTEAVLIRRADTGPELALTAGTNNNLYIQISRCPADASRIRVAASVTAADFPLRNPNCTGANNSKRRLIHRGYFIATCNDCTGAGDGIPTLKRIEMINGTLRLASIAEGVEQLQLEYGIDTTTPTADGVPDLFVKADAIDGTAPMIWPNVVATRIHMLVRNDRATAGYQDTRTYKLGAGVSIDKPNDGFKRTVASTTVRLVNVGGRFE